LSGTGKYSVAVALSGQDAATLLRLVTVLHRRGVHVVEAELGQPTQRRAAFTATFLATARQALVVAASLRNLIEVLGVELCEAPNEAENVVPIGPSWQSRGPRTSVGGGQHREAQ
jgi:acetolactate synthase regulatory subunit